MEGYTIKKLDFRSLFSGALPLFMLAHFVHHLVTALPVPILPFIREDFALDYTRSGLVISAFSLSYGLSQLPGGWLADRIGSRILITIGICGVALAGFLVGLSQTYIMMIVFLVLMGLIGGGYHPAAPPLVSASVEPKMLSRALGFHMAGGSAGYFLVPLIGAAIASAWGWRGSFIGLAIPTFVFGIVLYGLLGRQSIAKTTEPEMVNQHEEIPPRQNRFRHLVAFITLSTFIMAVVHSTTSFITLYMVDSFAVSKGTAAAFIALLFSCGLWVSPLGGYLGDRMGKVRLMIIVSLAAGPLVYLLNVVPYGFGFGALLVAIGIVVYARQPISESYIINQTSERNRSTVLGIYFFGGMEGSGIITPVLGYLIDRFGFYTSFTIVSITIVAVTLVCSIFLRGSRD